MKHLWLSVAVLLLGGVPLTAAALDYGPNSRLLAAETPAPQLPGAPVHGAASGEIPKPDVMTVDADDDANGAAATPLQQRMIPSSASPRPSPAPRNSDASANNKPRPPAAQPMPAPATASWQSLLPGSIQ